MKFAVAVIEHPDGKVELLASGDACQEVIDAYKAAGNPGKYHLCERVHFDRSKRIVSAVVPVQSESKPKRSKHIIP